MDLKYKTSFEELQRLKDALERNESLSSKSAGVFEDILNLSPMRPSNYGGSNSRVAYSQRLKEAIEQEKKLIEEGKRDYAYDPKQYPDYKVPNFSNKPEFLDRIMNPEKYPYIANKDGSVSTHKMAAEVDENGNWFVFPTIVMLPNGKLHEFTDTKQAMEYNLKTNNFLPMKSKKDALSYAEGGYKKGTPLEKFSPKIQVEDILTNPLTKGL